MIRVDWLWDREISPEQAKKILKNSQDAKFPELAALLLARKNTPQEVFATYLDKVTFVTHWARIKKRMRRDDWNSPRIEFWQAIYEKLYEVYKKEGYAFRLALSGKPKDDLCRKVGESIRNLRKEKKMTQKDLASALGVSQQIISQIEIGRHNVSLLNIKRVAAVLGKEVDVRLM